MSHMQPYSIQKTDHYTVLGLPAPKRIGEHPFSEESLKFAYRRALLLHHPDKLSKRQLSLPGSVDSSQTATNQFTIDQIIYAHEILANPTTRAQYEKDFLQDKRLGASASQKTSTVSETFDLEDLDYKESTENWVKVCRCGGTYQVSEEQLADAASSGEIIVGCQGCSLCIAVIFEALDE